MIFPHTISIADRAYSCSPLPFLRIDNEKHRPRSKAWFCPVCAQIWARSLVVGVHFVVMTVPCEAHQDPFVPYLIVAGSLYLPSDPAFNASLCEDLWRRELALHIKHYEKIGELG